MQEDGIAHPSNRRRPTLSGDCIEYYDAFCLLGASRIWNQVGPMPVETSEVMSLMWGMGITDPDERMKYLRLIKAMDRVELSFLHSKVRK